MVMIKAVEMMNKATGTRGKGVYCSAFCVLYPFPPKKTSDKNSFKENLLELGCFVFDIA